MKKVVFLILLGMLALNAFPQNSQGKLIGAGKGTKVGTANPPKKVTTPSAKQNPTGGKKYKAVDPNEKYASTGYMSITDLSFANIDTDNTMIIGTKAVSAPNGDMAGRHCKIAHTKKYTFAKRIN